MIKIDHLGIKFMIILQLNFWKGYHPSYQKKKIEGVLGYTFLAKSNVFLGISDDILDGIH